MDNGFSYEIVDDYDKVFDEKGNTFLSLRKLKWGGKEAVKFDMRKWYNNADGSEKCGKGFSFLTDEGPHELTKVLVEEGFGHTEDIINGIKDREDFIDSLVYALSDDNKEVLKKAGISEEYFDPKDIFGDDE